MELTATEVKAAVAETVAAIAAKKSQNDPVAAYLDFAALRDGVKLKAAQHLDANDAEVKQLVADLNAQATLADVVLMILEKAEKYLPLALGI